MINYAQIDDVITRPWNKQQSIEFDWETKKFVKMFIKEYYRGVREGLLDYDISGDKRRELLTELCNLLEGSHSELENHIVGCIKGEKNGENQLINDIFKLQDCSINVWEE